MTDRGTPQISVLIADDQSLFREGLRKILAGFDDLIVTGEAANGLEAVRLAEQTAPDVVLMDLRMPVLDGVAATRRLREALPHVRVIALTTFDDDALVYGCLRAGAVGYLLKDVASKTLVDAIRAAAQGKSVLDPSVAAKVIAEFTRMSERANKAGSPPIEPISNRELEVLALVADGATNRRIAEALFIAEGTVKNHITNILGKLGVHDRGAAVRKARDLGLI